jgi:hypothetical protein
MPPMVTWVCLKICRAGMIGNLYSTSPRRRCGRIRETSRASRTSLRKPRGWMTCHRQSLEEVTKKSLPPITPNSQLHFWKSGIWKQEGVREVVTMSSYTLTLFRVLMLLYRYQRDSTLMQTECHIKYFLPISNHKLHPSFFKSGCIWDHRREFWKSLPLWSSLPSVVIIDEY